ncbi:transglycosylase SLT domain-containing protein [Pseudomonas fluorescens]|uniref:transglycosylase SLT domain-containing protein n=1 Tax=Pseudomonas fluorescens TaxID=294 RepID=UPI001BED1ED9|nr:transglycosylase SLT domain-containing protein [Pseudomonas fluorescens]MBT2375321.1 transglycosylase SLT domain-containing protein [Pseudomonas fluorescens]
MAAPVKLRLSLSMLLVLAPLTLSAQIPETYHQVARQAGVPTTVLYAMALQESGVSIRKRYQPWPWTLNVAGKGRYFTTRDAACRALLQARQHMNAKHIDVGLMQLNLGYQRRHYQQPCDLLDPTRNLKVAATILRQHRRVGEDWLPAVGRYHRPAGGAPAARYRRNVARHLSQLVAGGK